jgi:Ca-activated chloride channel family protein
MGGLPMQRALEAAKHFVATLADGDYLSVVSFDDLIEVAATCRRVGETRSSVLERLQTLGARGGTALHQGWLESCYQAQRGAQAGRLSRVLLLSDGQTNCGLTDASLIAAQVADWQRRGISTSTFGLGQGYNEDLLSRMACAGNGNFYHLQTPEDISSCFQTELHGMFSAFGTAVSLGVEALNGVKVLRVVNPLESTLKGRWKLADLVYGHPIDVVVELQVPPMVKEQDLCRFRVAWTEVQSGQRQRLERSLLLPVVPFGQLSEFPNHPEVAQKRAVQVAARALKDAVNLIDGKDVEQARQALRYGLEVLAETQPSAEVAATAKELRRLMESLERGALAAVRKQATFYSSSVSASSISLSGFGRALMELSPEERTPERIRQIVEKFTEPNGKSPDDRGDLGRIP